MSQKVIRTILFIFFLFLFNLVIAEETKVKLVKVKEFSSYEEYEKWKGVVKKPPRIKIEGDTIKFFNEEGEVIKEKKFNKYDEQKAKEIREKLKDESAEIQYESVKIMPNESGILLVKWSDFGIKGDSVRGIEIYDREGNLKGEIKDYFSLYPAPNGEYFIAFDVGEGTVVNILKVYDANGNLVYNQRPFDFYAQGLEITFSDDSRYAVITIDGSLKDGDGIIVYDRETNSIWKVFNKEWMIPYNGVSLLKFNKGIIISTNKGMYRFSMEGKQVWHNEDVKYDEEKKVGWISVFSVSPDEKDIVGYAWPGILYILDAEKGNLIKKIELSDLTKYKSSDITIMNQNNYFLFKNRGVFEFTPTYEDLKFYRDIYLINKQGQFLWKIENVDISVDAELTENEELVVKEVVKEKEKIFLYRIYKK